MLRLRNAVRPYAWGSHTVLAELLGRAVPAPHPEAELWIGAHPGDPSMVVAGDGTARSLAELIEADPRAQLGRAAERFGGRLPFLLKVLAVDKPLSLQAHPSAEQAAEGYRREEAAGIARDAGERNYPDPTAKPELVCALTEFHALAGFRRPERTAELLRALDVPALEPSVEMLAAGPDRLRDVFTAWITVPRETLRGLLPEVLDACAMHAGRRGPFELDCRTVVELGELYPDDAGVLAALLLNRVVLAPGEALFLPAGNLHAYLRGTSVEILANSDNVLRGGLTQKHVDVGELLRVLDFSAADQPVLYGERVAGHLYAYRTEAPEFELSRLEWTAGEGVPVVLGQDGPQAVICLAGSIVLHAPDGRDLTLRRGESAWVPACEGPVTASAAGGDHALAFRGACGRPA